VTVAELVAALAKYSPDTPVALATKRGEAEDFTVEFDGTWVVLEE
jgi:hypothetical protein